MAKKKEFVNIVEESFNEGYTSEPEMPATTNLDKQESPAVESPVPPRKVLTENEQLLRKIIAGDDATLQRLWGREGRSTYYLTDFLRACIDVKSHEDGMTKNAIVIDALTQYFNSDEKRAAKERVVSMAIKKMEAAIEEEKKLSGKKNK